MHDLTRTVRVLLTLILATVLLVSQSGCLVAAAVSAVTAVALMNDEEAGEPEYALTAEVRHDAKSVYASALRLSQEQPEVTTYPWDLSLRIDAVRDEGLGMVSLEMTPVGERLSQLVITARSSDPEESNQDLALRTLDAICADLGVRYSIEHDELALMEAELVQ